MVKKDNHTPLVDEAIRQIRSHLEFMRSLYDSEDHSVLGRIAWIGLTNELKNHAPDEIKAYIKEAL